VLKLIDARDMSKKIGQLFLSRVTQLRLGILLYIVIFLTVPLKTGHRVD